MKSLNSTANPALFLKSQMNGTMNGTQEASGTTLR